MSQKLPFCIGASTASNAPRQRAIRVATFISRAPTMRCRRFAFGAYKNPSFKSMRGYGVEVSFKKWAKIEAFGDTAIHPLETVLRWERMVEAGAPIADVVGHLVKGATGKRAMGRARLHRGGKTYSPATCAREQRSAARGVSPRSLQSDRKRNSPAGDLWRFSCRRGAQRQARRRWCRPRSIRLRCRRDIRAMRSARRHFGKSSIADVPFKITMVPEADGNGRLVFLSADLVRFKPRPRGECGCAQNQMRGLGPRQHAVEGDAGRR